MRSIESRSLEIAGSTEFSLEMRNEIDRVAVTGNCGQSEFSVEMRNEIDRVAVTGNCDEK